MAKIRFMRSSQAPSPPPSSSSSTPQPQPLLGGGGSDDDGETKAEQMSAAINQTVQARETNEQLQNKTATAINLNVVQSKAQVAQPQATNKKSNSDNKSIKRTKTSSGFKFFPSFYFSSSSSSSSNSSATSTSPPNPTPDSLTTGASANNKQQSTNAGPSIISNPLRSKSKRFSLSTSSAPTATSTTSTGPAAKRPSHIDALAAVVEAATSNVAAAAAVASSSSPSDGDATANSSKANITSNSCNKTVISTPLPPYEIEVTDIDGDQYIECPLCVLLVSYDCTPDLKTCGHRTCSDCMQRYLKTEINHSRLNITCPICSEPLIQNVIRQILNDDKFYFKYESFMLRKVLAAEPDARWCPAPDCGYAVLANGCASCPRLLCERDGCNTAFCYHCKQEWHPNQTCTAASAERNKRAGLILNALNISDLIEESNQSNGSRYDHRGGGGNSGTRKSSKTSQQQGNATLRPEDIKECPVCSSRIIKMNDGSCNHMTCSICETEFCWLCMKEISDFHYFSPSGCTFWGKKPWSKKKKFLWRLGMLVGAPVCIVFIAGISIPAIVIGIPFWAARKLHARLEKKQFSRYRKNAILTGGVLLSFLVSPIITAMALAVGIPLLLGYVYGVVPLSLCRSSGGCLSAAPSVENIHEQLTQAAAVARRLNNQATDVVSIDTATSRKLGNPSIGETSMYLSNISLETNSIGHVTSVERDDRETASNAALAGSIFSQNIDDGNSIRALAGSIISKDSGGYTLIPVEIHSHCGSTATDQPTSSLSSTTNNNRANHEQSETSDVDTITEQAPPTAAVTT